MDENEGRYFDINTDVEKLINLLNKNSQIPWDDNDKYSLSHFIHLLMTTIKDRKLVSNYFLYKYDPEYMKKIQGVQNYGKIPAKVEKNKGHVKHATRRFSEQECLPLQKIYVYCTAKRQHLSNFWKFMKVHNKEYILKSIVCRSKSNDPQYFVVDSYQNKFYIIGQCYSKETNLTEIFAENDVLVALYEQL
ncbi:hypothetical protein THOM_0069 [Trachipleistophora hominis]|uniref:Uncharacterized protein n=1 Tax=Trachipleistophora hominis TaxID=72359 RepID=L7K014_TRAHO|nr:hypothetical protein THOM_0069 [Trachipleistophora hominis]